MRKNIIRLTEQDLHNIVKESVSQILKESHDIERMIKEVLFNGNGFNPNNEEGYDIGIGYGCGNKKEFYYPYSQSLEHSFCHVTTEEINNVVKELESQGYEFEHDDDYVFMKGERNGFKPFRPSKPHPSTKTSHPNPNTDPVGYYSDRVFTKSKDGNLNLF